MPKDLMVELLADLQSRHPESAAMLDAIRQVHHTTSIADAGIDSHYLRYPPGHYYSPLPSREEFARVEQRVCSQPRELAGVDLREKEQFLLYARFVRWYEEMPFGNKIRPGLRYYFDNEAFGYADAFWLYAFMREFKPRRIVEVGSGFSSCVILDTNERFLDSKTHLTFVEPYPERLFSLLRPGERERLAVHENFVQDVSLDVFAQLEAGDFLFIDSSHVGKIGSDVLYLLHVVLPSLKPGVMVHFHDIFYPFEYPHAWLSEGIAWNECYFMHTFLQYNSSFAIRLFGHYLGTQHPEMFRKLTPLCLRNIGGSLWLEKLE